MDADKFVAECAAAEQGAGQVLAGRRWFHIAITGPRALVKPFAWLSFNCGCPQATLRSEERRLRDVVNQSQVKT